jgi:FKBP-type peptidyl-prolyl cis-trans isomerase
MPVGSKFKVWLPSELAYGSNGYGEAIKPFSTLIFEIELIDIVE